VSLVWTDDPRDFADPAWAALCEADPEATFFHSPRYLKLYWEEMGRGRLQIAVLDDAARAAFELHEGVLWFLGGTEVTDYMGPVAPPENRERAAKELVEALAARHDWELADLRGMPEEGAWLGALREAARSSGLHAQVEDEGVAPMLELPESFDAYLASLSPKRRHEIRRKARRLWEAVPEATVVETAPEELGEALERFFHLHRSSTGPKGKFMQPGMELFFRRLADEFLPEGTLRLVFLSNGDDRLAGVVTFRWRDAVLLYNSAYDHARRERSPGMVLVGEIVRGAIESGCARLDLRKGDLDYKYRFGARPRRIPRLLLTRT
jgi:CelD/BcsL family acetyltransferase involved in cellulose biosynthesis